MIAIYHDDMDGITIWTNTDSGGEGIHITKEVDDLGKDGRCLAIGKNPDQVFDEAIKELENDLATLRKLRAAYANLPFANLPHVEPSPESGKPPISEPGA